MDPRVLRVAVSRVLELGKCSFRLYVSLRVCVLGMCWWEHRKVIQDRPSGYHTSTSPKTLLLPPCPCNKKARHSLQYLDPCRLPTYNQEP